MKKLGLRTVLFCLLFVLFVVSCKEKSANEPALETSSVEFPGGWKPTTDYSERLTISSAMLFAIDGYDYNNGDDYAKWFTSHFNINMEVTALSAGNQAERLRLWIASGDMPDVVMINYAHPDVAGWIEQGLVKKFPDNWKQRWPNTAQAAEASGLGPEMEKVFGGTYFIPRPVFDKNKPGDAIPSHLSFYFRRDWAESVGFPVKSAYTIPEIIEFGRLVKEKDPGRVGERLIPLSGSPFTASRLFVDRNSTHANNFYKDKSGLYRWGAADDATLRGLKYYYRAWSSEILDSEFYTRTFGIERSQMLVSGISGGMFYTAPVSQLQINWNMIETNLEMDPDKCLAAATVLGDDGYYHEEGGLNFWGCLVFTPSISDAKFERYMDMMDFGCTEKGYYMNNMGLEGIDWQQDSDGTLVSLVPPGTIIQGQSGKYPSLNDAYIMGQVKLFDDFNLDSPIIPEKHRNLLKQMYRERVEYSTPDTLTLTDWTLFCFDSPSMRKVLFDYPTEYSSIITGAKSEAEVESLWRRWIDNNRALVDPVLKELNSL
jgi:putative aldouronate transport system substrate-binding protein